MARSAEHGLRKPVLMQKQIKQPSFTSLQLPFQSCRAKMNELQRLNPETGIYLVPFWYIFSAKKVLIIQLSRTGQSPVNNEHLKKKVFT